MFFFRQWRKKATILEGEDKSCFFFMFFLFFVKSRPALTVAKECGLDLFKGARYRLLVSLDAIWSLLFSSIRLKALESCSIKSTEWKRELKQKKKRFYYSQPRVKCKYVEKLKSLKYRKQSINYWNPHRLDHQGSNGEVESD